MSVDPSAPGAAPVGHLLDLPPLERQLILYLRLWCDGPSGQAEVWQDLCARHGAEDATRVLRRFEELLGGTLRHARRPLQRHALTCPCAGGDECVFARFVALAAEGAREDACLIAALMVRTDMALILHGVAEDLGLLLMRGQLPPTVVRLTRAERTHRH